MNNVIIRNDETGEVSHLTYPTNHTLFAVSDEKLREVLQAQAERPLNNTFILNDDLTTQYIPPSEEVEAEKAVNEEIMWANKELETAMAQIKLHDIGIDDPDMVMSTRDAALNYAKELTLYKYKLENN